jgi:starch synthase
LGNREEVQAVIQAADCLVCPSIWQEAAGLVNIEALACGVPVVASRVGGIPEIVEHGATGLLFAAGEPDELAAAIRRLMEDPDLVAKMGEAARTAAIARFSPARLSEFLDFYQTNEKQREVGG